MGGYFGPNVQNCAQRRQGQQIQPMDPKHPGRFLKEFLVPVLFSGLYTANADIAGIQPVGQDGLAPAMGSPVEGRPEGEGPMLQLLFLGLLAHP